jgi:purine-binding chemotaxis protein CheW
MAYSLASSASVDAKQRIEVLDPASGSVSVLLVFQLSNRLAAVRLEEVEKIVPMAELSIPPGMPSVLEGVLNLAGVAISVLRLDRLFELPTQHLGLYSMLVILSVSRGARIGVLVERATEIVPVSENAFVAVGEEEAFNGCAEATVMVRDEIVHVLSPARILLAKEEALLAEFQTMAQKRLQDWQVSQA